MSTAAPGCYLVRLAWLAAVAAAPLLSIWSMWPASAQQAPQPAHHESAAPAPHHQGGSALAGLRKRFDEFLDRTSPAWKRPSAKQREEMFQEYLAWPRNPLEVELTVRLTFPGGVGPVIGTLSLKNGETAVAGRKEAALFIRPNVRGLPQGLYAFHVHEHPNCGSAPKDGAQVPGLAAGTHLWLSGTGALSGTTFATHLGDLPDLKVDADGTARTLVVAARLTLADVARRSFIIHASQDDTSERLACAAFD